MINQKPCLVETTQGFSVSYKEHLLYSKYNPAKNIVKKIQDTTILPGSVILCLSPVLPHGIPELIAQLPQDCMVILCEKEDELYEFSRARYADTALLTDKRLFYPAPDQLKDLPQWIYSQNKKGTFRRVIYFDCSAGSQFNADFYKALVSACTDSIMTFWKNRVTLTKFGRKYSRHFFANLKAMATQKCRPIESYFASVTKPILCFGAGESTDYFFEENNINCKDYFILCADSALSALTERGITPDGVFLEEAQSVILKSFIGNTKNTGLHIFAGLSSTPGVRRAFPGEQISYFFTEFTQAEFLGRAEEAGILPHKNPAFGSVGLTMVYYALRFRASDDIPVYLTGLDFSYSAGRTHTRGTPHHKNRLIAQTKLKAIADFNSAYNPNAFAFTDKAGNKFYTTQILSSYSQLFTQFFGGVKNLFDAGKTGIPLGLAQKLVVDELAVGAAAGGGEAFRGGDGAITINSDKITKYIEGEKKALVELRRLLTEKQDMTSDKLQKKITELAAGREYLFLHYPDGVAFRYDQSFLNRVRTEIDFFLQVLTN